MDGMSGTDVSGRISEESAAARLESVAIGRQGAAWKMKRVQLRFGADSSNTNREMLMVFE